MLTSRRLVPATLALTLALGLGLTALTQVDGPAPQAGPAPSAPSQPAAPMATASEAAPTPPAPPVIRATAAPTSPRTTATTARPGPRPLPRPMHGRAAVQALGDKLPDVARLNRRTSAELTDLLTNDSTLWLNSAGRLFVKDALPAGKSTGTPAAAPIQPLEKTFALHSLPGSRHVVFLDFDGVDVGDLAWTDPEVGKPVPKGHHAGWDPAEDGPSFSAAERTAIQEIWARVAEDFAPFDIDVTTEDPGKAALTRTDSSDLNYGTHLVVTDSQTAWDSVCQSNCAGMAWLGHFGVPETNGEFQLAWVFAGGTDQMPQTIAEAAAHEVGHTFDLSHDGTTAAGEGSYYEGHAPWGPIMGMSYDRGVSQWSRGDYPGANNKQDDIAIISARVPLRPDEAGDTRAAASPLPTGTAYITSRTDVDHYQLGRCIGPVKLTAQPATTGANLDVQLSLVDANGTTVATSAPATKETVVNKPYPWDAEMEIAAAQISGLDAAITTTLPEGQYFAVVQGGGAQEGGGGNPLTDYDNYGSLGAYTVSVRGCSGAREPAAPAKVERLSARAATARGQVTLTWAAPTDDGGATVTDYVVQVGAQTQTTTGTSLTLSGLAVGVTHRFTVAARNEIGTGAVATTSLLLATAPTAPRIGSAVSGAKGGPTTVRFSWAAPTNIGGSPARSSQVMVYTFKKGRQVSAKAYPAGATARALELRLPATKGVTYAAAVRVLNGVGWSPFSAKSKPVVAR